MVESSIDEKLWDAAQILTQENRTYEAASVIQSIASHVVGRYSGKLVDEVVLTKSKKELKVEQLTSMKELSKEISLLVENHKYEEARERAMDYVDGIVSLLASDHDEEQRLRRIYLKNLIHFNAESQRIKAKLYRGLGNFRPNSQDVIVTTAIETYTTSEAAEILNVSDQTIRRMCEAGKFPDATRTDGGHWRIPKKHFKVTLEQSKQIEKNLAHIRRKSDEGGQVDEFDL